MTPINNLFRRIPFIRITCLFILGILVNQYIVLNDCWLGILFLLLLLVLIFLWNNKHFSIIQIQDVILIIVIFLSGLFYPAKSYNDQQSIPIADDFFIAEICQKPVEKLNTYQTFLLIENNKLPKTQKVIAYFDKKDFDTSLMAGDQLLVHTTLQKIKSNANIYDFNYQSIMHKIGIHYSVYLPALKYKKTGIRSNKLIYFAERVRDKLIFLLNQTTIEKNELAVISALTLGYRSELDKETRNYFTDTGTIHVLSVSGLHVALIFYIISLLFSPINRGKSAKYIYPALMIMFLWSYAFITGFSPPVQRATLVFSFVIIGNVLRRPINIYNSLFASAFILILYDPHVLFDIGFQLSYLAIFGIVLLQPPLEKILQVNNKLLKWAWTLFTVSIAAQITTFPLSVYYFKQFPNLFWLSNFIAIPGTTFILWITMVFLVLSPLSTISNLIAQILQFITHQILLILKWLSNLPHAVSEGIIFSPFQTIIMYGLLTTIVIYCFSKNKRWLFISMTLLICFQSANLIAKLNTFNQVAIYVYQSKNNIIHCINGRNSYILKNDNLPFTNFDLEMIQNLCYNLKLNKPKFIKLEEYGNQSMHDLLIKSKNINFLNCTIGFNDQIDFTVYGKNLREFQLANPGLFEETQIQNEPNQFELLEGKKELFSINFSLQYKKAQCIFIK